MKVPGAENLVEVYSDGMNRRNFLRTSAYVSAGIVAGVRPALAADADTLQPYRIDAD
jgi:hypothetical protein